MNPRQSGSSQPGNGTQGISRVVMVEQPAPDSDDRAPSARELIERGLTLTKRALRFWPVLAASGLVAVAASVLVPKMIPPVFTSQTTLLYRELIQTTSLLGRDAPVESNRQRGSRLREMLLSRSNFEKIIKKLDLYKDTVKSRGMIEAVEEFRRRAECRVGEDTYAIKYEGDDPVTVHRVTEQLANSLREQSHRYRIEQAESTRSFLEAQRNRVNKELDGKEQRLAEFLERHPEFAQDAAMPGGRTGAAFRAQERKAASFAPGLSALARQRKRLRGRLRAPTIAPNPTIFIAPAAAAAISGAERDVERANGDLRSAQARYTDKHPDVLAAKRRVASATAALSAAKTAAASGSSTYGGTSARPVDRKDLEAQLRAVEENIERARQKKRAPKTDSKAKTTSSWIVDLETRWGSLNRDVNEVRERYAQIQRRLFQASIIAKVEASGNAAQMVVIDPSYKPERPTRRGSRRVGAVAALVALIFGAAIAFSLAYLDDRAYEEQDIRRMKLGGLTHSVPRAKASSMRSARHG